MPVRAITKPASTVKKRGFFRLSSHDRTQIEADMLNLLRRCEVALQQLQHSLQGVTPDTRNGPNAAEVAHFHGVVRLSHLPCSPLALLLAHGRQELQAAARPG
jgi:hypothetical protein